MAGDPLRDAFRAELAAVLAVSPTIPWTVKDVQNTAEQPAPPAAGVAGSSAGWFEIEFPGGSEQQYTFGAPGLNWHRERGQVTIRAVTRLRAGKTIRDLAESYLSTVRSRFRLRRFSAGSLQVRIIATMPMGGGVDEGGQWVESLALEYQMFNVG